MLLTSLRRAGVIGNGSGKQVLVVDADPQTLQLAGAALDSSGYQTSCYSNAQSALQQAADSDRISRPSYSICYWPIWMAMSSSIG